MNYYDYNDQQILGFIQENNEEALELIYKKYTPLIQITAKKFWPYCKNAGVELNDLEQEGMLGLNNAIEHCKDSKETIFYSFAKTCIERKMISFVVASRRLKHKILNESISLDYIDKEGRENNLENLFFDEKQNPELLVFHHEENKKVMDYIKQKLTDFEWQVFELKYHNFNYREIATLLDKDPKAIDNALQRIKGKVKKVLESKK